MNKRKNIILVICISVSILIIMAVTVFAATGNIIEEHLAEKKESMSTEGLKIKSDVSSDSVMISTDRGYENYTDQYNSELIGKYNKAVADGFVFQYEMFLNEDYLHSYKFVKAFTQDELQTAVFEDDYSVININGTRYYVKWGYPGDFKEADAQLPEIDRWTVILRIFSEDNWQERNVILAKETYVWVKNSVVVPIMENGIEIINNDDNSVVRKLSPSDISDAKISENGIFIKLDNEIYIVNSRYVEGNKNEQEIILRPLNDYEGDGKILDPDKYEYYSINEWLSE